MANINISGSNITVKQGTTIEWAYTLNDATNTVIDITDWSLACQVRKTFDATTPVLTPVVTNGGVTGTFTLRLEPAMTSDVRFSGDSLECVYDVEVTDQGGAVTRIAEGTFTISREVTR